MYESTEPTGDPDVGGLASAIYDALIDTLLYGGFTAFDPGMRARAEFEIRAAISAWVEAESVG